MRTYFRRLFDWRNRYRAILHHIWGDFKNLVDAIFFLVIGIIRLPWHFIKAIFHPHALDSETTSRIPPHVSDGHMTQRRDYP